MKWLWILAVIINLSGVIWFILGSTANFQRGIDLITTVIMIGLVTPSLLLIVLSVILLVKRWSSQRIGIIGIFVLIISMLLLTPLLYKNVNTSGWLTERVMTDSMQITTDGHYEYCIEIINIFQRNSYARLYLKDITKAEEKRIRLSLPIYEIHGIGIERVNYWIKLEPISKADTYILHTTEDFPLSGERFEIDVINGHAVKIE
jgi:membrane-bound ClpP family serine protease